MRSNSLISVVKLLTLVVVVLMTATACVTKEVQIKSKEASAANAQIGAKYLQDENLDLDQARIKLEKALDQDSSNALAHVYYGQLQHLVRNDDKARVHFNKAIKLEPEVAEHRNNYGVFLCQIEEYESAIAEFEKAANNPYYTTPEFALDNAGLCMLDSNQYEQASGFLRAALRKNPKFANAFLHMSELLYKQGKMTVSNAYYQRFLANGRDTPESLLLGINLYRDLGKRTKAEQYASRLLNDHPESIEAGEYLAQPIQ